VSAPTPPREITHPDQPDGIDEYSRDYPDVARAARRVNAWIREWGDGLIQVTNRRPLYARDLEALRRAAESVAGFQALEESLIAECNRLRAEADRLRETLREVLSGFYERGHPGFDGRRTGWVRVDTLDRWRAALGPDAPVEPGLVSKIAAGAGSIPLGRTAVVTLTTTGHLDVAACYDTTAIAQRQAARLRGTHDVNVYLVRKHRGGTTVYLDQDTVLGTVDAPVEPVAAHVRADPDLSPATERALGNLVRAAAATPLEPAGEVLHIRHIGAYRSNLCGQVDGEATYPSAATCQGCRDALADADGGEPR
jgi:hypothetical protein